MYTVDVARRLCIGGGGMTAQLGMLGPVVCTHACVRGAIVRQGTVRWLGARHSCRTVTAQVLSREKDGLLAT